MDTRFMEHFHESRDAFESAWDAYQNNGSSFDPEISKGFGNILDQYEVLRQKILHRHELEILTDYLPEIGDTVRGKPLPLLYVRELFSAIDEENFICIAGPLKTSVAYRKLKKIFWGHFDLTVMEAKQRIGCGR